MNKQFPRFTLYAIIIYLTGGELSLDVGASPPAGAGGTHFHGVTDAQWNKQHSDQLPNRHYARTFAANLNVGEPRTVRMIYFLPNDRSFRADVIRQMKDEIRTAQTFYAEQMEAHGYGKVTFRVETDAQGEPIVHRVKGQYAYSHYLDIKDELSEIEQMFDLNANIYHIVIDRLAGFANARGKNDGVAWLTSGSPWEIVAHELGHAFGLSHDFRDRTYIMSYGPGENRLSVCSAEYLSVHPYFNPDIPIEEEPPPIIELISPHVYPAGAGSVPVRIEVSDFDGLHQVILHAAQPDNRWSVKSCRGFSGEKSAIIEFDYDGVIPSAHEPSYSISTSLLNPLVHPIYVEAVDMNGNVGGEFFSLFSETLQPLSKISGDNQHGLPNTPLPSPFVIKVRDLNDGSGRQGILVTFAITAGGGLLSVEHVETSYNGTAQTTLTLGPNFGTTTVEVSAAGIENTVTFNAVAGAALDIPDTNLRAAIEKELGTASGEPIAPADIATLIDLRAPEADISNLTGLEGATSLRSLYLWDNNISDISAVAGLTKLIWLRLDGNSISDISPVAGLTTLRILQLGFNNTSDISMLTELPQLQYLSLNVNNISNISALVGLTDLVKLELGDNNISDIAVLAGLTELTWLGLRNNNISDISMLAGLTKLTHLSLEITNISDITVLAGLTDLTWLDLGSNNISDISVLAGLTKPEGVSLRLNNISDISPVAGLTTLTWLRLGGNSISDISPVSRLTDLTYLDLWGNNISDLSSLVANTGLGQEDEVYVEENPLSYQSIHTHIPILEERGVEIYFNNLAHPALLKISGDNQKGTAFVPLSQPFVVEAQDENGSVLTGISVTFAVTTGGGTLNTTITRTDTNGRAQSTLTLGPNLGKNTVQVFAFGIEVPATFHAISDTEAPSIAADVNGDGSVNVLDLVLIASELGKAGTNLAADVSGDGVVNILDLILVAGMFDGAAAAPAAQPQVPETLTAVEVQGWLTDARALEVRDPIMKRGFVMLEQFLVSLTPKETELLANYPNPFNPETWIPYRLAEDAFVTLIIYDTAGQVVRTLEVGHRIASAYESQSKAIYWDGKNDFGEQVASGVYFYTLTAGDFSATRRMVILK